MLARESTPSISLVDMYNKYIYIILRVESQVSEQEIESSARQHTG